MSSTAATIKRQDLKKGHDSTDLRRRRGETTVNLRKLKKEQGLAKRRNTASILSGPEEEPLKTRNNCPVAPRVYTVRDIPSLAQALTSPVHDVRTDAARGLRKLLSREGNPPVEEVIRSGAMPLLVKYLDENDNTDLQFETAWALTNIASTTKTQVVVDQGAVPALVRNLRHHNPELREQCAWCLGNIAGDSVDLRNSVLCSTNALEGLLINVTQPASASLLHNCVWALSNFCRGKPQPDMELVQPAVPILSQLLTCDDSEVLVDACWALSYLSDGDSDRIQHIMDAGTAPNLAKLLGHESCHVVTPALRTLGNFVTGEDAQTQAVLDVGVLPLLESLLHHKKKNIRKEACWTLSNVAAGTPSQLEAVCMQPGVIAGVIELLEGGEWEVQKEANFVISNIATAGNEQHVRQVVEMDAIPALCQMLDRADAKGVLVTLEALSSILVHDPPGSPWATLVDEAEGLDR
ncbi:unnamed protein product, partial [Choristocarpus tenellus]